jgi:O-antigen ligase
MGPFSSENNLGAQALFVFVWSLGGLRGRLRLAAIGFAIAVLGATFSRTSIITAGVCLALYLLFALRRASSDMRPAPLWLAALFGVSATALGWFLVRQSADSTFSQRGLIWHEASKALEDHPVRGLGLHAWFELQSIGLLPDHFAHSQYLLLAFSGGYIALLLYAAVLALGLRHCAAVPGRWGVSCLPMLALAIVGLTEVAWNPFTFDGLTWPVLAVLLLTLERPVEQEPAEAGARAAARGRVRSPARA